MVRGMAWNTAFPPAEFFEGFDRVTENGAEKLFNLYIAETNHRRTMDRRGQLFPFIVQLVGRTYALLALVGMLIITAIAISEKASWIALIFGSGVLGIIINAFVKFTRSSPRPGSPG